MENEKVYMPPVIPDDELKARLMKDFGKDNMVKELIPVIVTSALL